MCGFTGYWNLNKKEEKGLATIRQMTLLQKHRGPDDTCLYGINTLKNSVERSEENGDHFQSGNDMFFGFNRLSILDLSRNGRQPMVDESENVVLMMNGEIYNAFDYKNILESKGYKFKSTTDTEVVLALYLEYGADMLQKLNGMFAIVIWDSSKKRLLLARDRFGIKPLYYTRQNGRFLFSSELKSFKGIPEFNFELDKEKIDEFLLFRNVIHDTLFKSIANCEPGTYLTVDSNGDQRSHKYYSVDDEGFSRISGNDAQEKLETFLELGVRRQMISDVKLGCQLSGGVDSSLVTYFASNILKKGDLETISIKFTNPDYSEEEYIDIVADTLELDSHKFNLDPSYYFENMENVTWHFEQPINHPNTIGIYLLSQEAKKYLTVLLSGEGADEILSGYNRFLGYSNNPFINQSFIRGLINNYRRIPAYLGYYKNTFDRFIMSSAFTNLNIASELYSGFKQDKALAKRRNIIRNLKGNDRLKLRKYELLTYLPDLLMRQDKMSMAHSIENRVPFLDNDVVSTSLNISDQDLVKKRFDKYEGKFLLKKICMNKFGESFAFRSKQGFGIPLREFINTPDFQNRWFEVIEPGIKKRGIFHVGKLSKWVSNAESISSEKLDAIWLMTGFEIWAKQYLNN